MNPACTHTHANFLWPVWQPCCHGEEWGAYICMFYKDKSLWTTMRIFSQQQSEISRCSGCMLPPQPITSIQYCCSTKCADVCFWWKPQEQQREPCTLNMSRSRVPVCVCIRFYLIRQSRPSSLFPELSLLVFSVFSVLLCLPNTVSRFTSCLFVYLNSVQLHLVFLPFPLPLSARVYL